jgi:hypothetical protein
MKHFSEEELIAYQLGDTSSREAADIRQHLDSCLPCAALTDSIAETLRVFSAEPVPTPDLEHNWQRLRGNLHALEPKPRRRFLTLLWAAPAAGLVAAALLLIVFTRQHHRITNNAPNYAINGHGPLTTQPVEPVTATSIASHLDAAERLLTEVNNSSGPIDDATRDQAHQLLLTNAVYVRTARANGNLGQAIVLDDLGRVLTNLEHETDGQIGNLHFRIEMNTDTLLLNIRILRQNDNRD